MIAIALLVACSDVVGLEDHNLTSGTGSAGAAGVGGGAGGSGGGFGSGGSGGASGEPAPDWTVWFAYYRMETSDLGIEENQADFNLAEMNSPLQAQPGFAGSLGALQVQAMNGGKLHSPHQDFATPEFTFGAWLRAAINDGGDNVIGKWNALEGYVMARDGDALSASCLAGDGLAVASAGVEDVWPLDAWVYVVCRATTTSVNVFAHREVQDVVAIRDADDVGAVITFSQADFEVGTVGANPQFEGLIDDLFFVNRPIDDDSIERIWACGIDGSGCRCDATGANGYQHCGRADPGLCSALTPCDQDQPGYL